MKYFSNITTPEELKKQFRAYCITMHPDKDRPYILYCRSGRRSAEAAHKLDELGYTQLYDVGSLIGWPYGLE